MQTNQRMDLFGLDQHCKTCHFHLPTSTQIEKQILATEIVSFQRNPSVQVSFLIANVLHLTYRIQKAC